MSCPEEQPRPLPEIVNSAWEMAGPRFQSMSAQQVRMVERLVREAYQRGSDDRWLKREPEPAPLRKLEWHKGTHSWKKHDGFPRHAHSQNGQLTIDPHDTQPHFAHGPAFKEQ